MSDSQRMSSGILRGLVESDVKYAVGATTRTKDRDVPDKGSMKKEQGIIKNRRATTDALTICRYDS
jgi:hypothetical protein